MLSPSSSGSSISEPMAAPFPLGDRVLGIPFRTLFCMGERVGTLKWKERVVWQMQHTHGGTVKSPDCVCVGGVGREWLVPPLQLDVPNSHHHTARWLVAAVAH